MPTSELFELVSLQDDEFVSFSPQDNLAVTKKGDWYLRSQEGHVFYDNKWEPKYIWCRA